MSSPPWKEPSHRAGLFQRPVRSSAGSRWPQALAQIRKQLPARSFVLAAWPSCRGPRQLAASGLAVVPSATPGSPSPNAWPARPRHVRPRHIIGQTSLRALKSVPSRVALRTYVNAPRQPSSSGSVVLLKTGSEISLGPTKLLSTVIGGDPAPNAAWFKSMLPLREAGGDARGLSLSPFAPRKDVLWRSERRQ